ncbi:phosphate ABC transporter permease PstA [Spiroplasma endosymbiont of Anurida maritima]|uniref:phosphate ABC transporter permease PstA n=1 Tax=Spiroplasma endosymbiont of Anurida maritima TaxID=2967972 RepID=UPI0036D37FDB
MKNYFQNKLDVFKSNFQSKKNGVDFASKIFIYIFAVLTILILFTLIGFIIYKSVFFLDTVDGGFWGFISGNTWNTNNDQYGIWGIIISTFFLLLIALIFAVPLTIFSSLFICEYLSNTWKRRITRIINILAGIPSVVFGLFALTTIGPIFKLMGAPSSANLITAAVTLAFMGLPIMISLSINAIEKVPASYRLGSLALGLSRTHTTFRIVLKSAGIKIVAAIMMGVARIIGETMAVMMIAGNAPDGLALDGGLLDFLFSSIATLSSIIGIEMLENSGPLHESSLYAIGLILFILVCFINIIVLGVQSYSKSRINGKRRTKRTKELAEPSSQQIKQTKYRMISKIEKNRNLKKVYDGIGMGFLISSAVIVVGFTLWILLTILVQGLFGMNWPDLVSTQTTGGQAGILSSLLVTLLLVLCALIFAIPLSLFVAIFLNEYASPNNFFTKFLRFSIDVLASTPSIIFGTFGLAFFIGVMNIPLSVWAAGLTLTIVVMPVMIRSIENSLSFVDMRLRKASLALGANKTSTILKVVIPNAMPGIITGIILAVGRIIGESAPVYLTLGTAVRLPMFGFSSPGASMSTEILMLFKEGVGDDSVRIMYELAFVIMVLILLSNLSSEYLGKKFSPEYMHVPFKTKWKQRIDAIKYNPALQDFLSNFKKAKNEKVND